MVEQVDIGAVERFSPASLPDMSSLTDRAMTLIVDCPEAAQKAATIKKGFIALRKAIKDYFEPHTSAANKIHKWITGRREAMLDQVVLPEKIIDQKLINWEILQQTLANQAAAAAKIKAEEERKRQQAEADLLAELDPSASAVIAPVLAVSEYVPPPKVEGIAMVDYYGAELINLMDTVKAVAAGTCSLNALTGNDRWVNDRAKSMRGEFNVPGYRLVVTRKPRGTR